MNSRVLGVKEGLTTPIIIHIALALLLVPLLILKVIIARYFKNNSAVLLALGLTILVLSILLVSITTFPELWTALATVNVPLSASIGVIIAICAFCGTLLLHRRAVTSPPVATSVTATDDNGPSQRSGTVQQISSLILRLARLQAQTRDTKTLRFLVPQHDKLLAQPGQFLTFDWMVDGKSVVRSYSISSSPLQTGYIKITVKRVENGWVSVFLNDRAQIGLTVEATGPFGQFYFDEMQHESIVLIAGGSGITPMMSMLRYIDDRCLTTDVDLIYFVRTPKDIIFATELEQLCTPIRSFRYVVVVSAPDKSWNGSRGHLSQGLLEIRACLNNGSRKRNQRKMVRAQRS